MMQVVIKLNKDATERARQILLLNNKALNYKLHANKAKVTVDSLEELHKLLCLEKQESLGN